MQIHWWQSPHDQWAQLLRQCRATSGGAARARCARGTTQTTPGSLHCNSCNQVGVRVAMPQLHGKPCEVGWCSAQPQTLSWPLSRTPMLAPSTGIHGMGCWTGAGDCRSSKLGPLLPGFSHSGARGVSPSVPGPFPPWGLHITIIPICNATWEGTLLQSCFFICKEAPHQCYPGCIIQECILPVTEER